MCSTPRKTRTSKTQSMQKEKNNKLRAKINEIQTKRSIQKQSN
jgi:hypothetical protein